MACKEDCTYAAISEAGIVPEPARAALGAVGAAAGSVPSITSSMQGSDGGSHVSDV